MSKQALVGQSPVKSNNLISEDNLLVERRPIEIVLSKRAELKKNEDEANQIKSTKKAFLKHIFWYAGTVRSFSDLHQTDCCSFPPQEMISGVLRKFSDQELVILTSHLIQEAVKRADYIKKSWKVLALTLLTLGFYRLCLLTSFLYSLGVRIGNLAEFNLSPLQVLEEFIDEERKKLEGDKVVETHPALDTP